MFVADWCGYRCVDVNVDFAESPNKIKNPNRKKEEKTRKNKQINKYKEFIVCKNHAINKFQINFGMRGRTCIRERRKQSIQCAANNTYIFKSIFHIYFFSAILLSEANLHSFFSVFRFFLIFFNTNVFLVILHL